MGAQMVRLNTIASNLANMESKASTPKKPSNQFARFFKPCLAINMKMTGWQALPRMKSSR
jgi:flagellar basal body rod protein FlgC